MRLRFTFADQDFTATLEDHPTARDLMSLLPLDLRTTRPTKRSLIFPAS